MRWMKSAVFPVAVMVFSFFPWPGGFFGRSLWELSQMWVTTGASASLQFLLGRPSHLGCWPFSMITNLKSVPAPTPWGISPRTQRSSCFCIGAPDAGVQEPRLGTSPQTTTRVLAFSRCLGKRSFKQMSMLGTRSITGCSGSSGSTRDAGSKVCGAAAVFALAFFTGLRSGLVPVEAGCGCAGCVWGSPDLASSYFALAALLIHAHQP
mmetsp:Transcript_35245/g.84491  ORF Transcript_35245/g.84491 Transcript_35245/m.84491 type:complete len:208 (-) Transcript_35245:15-638(-)